MTEWECYKCLLHNNGFSRVCEGYPDWCQGSIRPAGVRQLSIVPQQEVPATAATVAAPILSSSSSASAACLTPSELRRYVSESDAAPIVVATPGLSLVAATSKKHSVEWGDALDDPILDSQSDVPRRPPIKAPRSKKQPLELSGSKVIEFKGRKIDIINNLSEDPGTYRFNYMFIDINKNWNGPNLQEIFDIIERDGFYRFQYVDPFEDPAYKLPGKEFPWLRIRKSRFVASHKGKYYSIRYELANDASLLHAHRTLGFRDGNCIGTNLWEDMRNAEPDKEWCGTFLRAGVIVNHTQAFLDGLANLWFANNFNGLVDPDTGYRFASRHNNIEVQLCNFRTIPEHSLGGRVRVFTKKAIQPFESIGVAYSRSYVHALGPEVFPAFLQQDEELQQHADQHTGSHLQQDVPTPVHVPTSPADAQQHRRAAPSPRCADTTVVLSPKSMESPSQHSAATEYLPYDDDDMPAYRSNDNDDTVIASSPSSPSESSDSTIVYVGLNLQAAPVSQTSGGMTVDPLELEAEAVAHNAALHDPTEYHMTPPPTPSPSDENITVASEQSPPVDTQLLYHMRESQREYERDQVYLADVEFVATAHQSQIDSDTEGEHNESLTDSWRAQADVLEKEQSQDY